MTHDPDATAESDGFHRPHVNSALVVSAQSVAWTVAASTAAVALGIHSGTAVLVAFGAIGIVDAIGSIALVYHFHHGIRHDELSEELERLAHRVVLVGLFLVGSATIIGGLVRLTMDQSSEPSAVGVALAAVSFVALVALSARKQRIARRVSSNALLSDGHLSAIGATQAAVTLAGTAATLWLAWHWADAAATAIVGCVAVTLAIFTWRAEHQRSSRTRPTMTAPRIALLALGIIAIADWLLRLSPHPHRAPRRWTRDSGALFSATSHGSCQRRRRRPRGSTRGGRRNLAHLRTCNMDRRGRSRRHHQHGTGRRHRSSHPQTASGCVERLSAYLPDPARPPFTPWSSLVGSISQSHPNSSPTCAFSAAMSAISHASCTRPLRRWVITSWSTWKAGQSPNARERRPPRSNQRLSLTSSPCRRRSRRR